MTRVLPWRKLGIATLMVAVKMNKISWAVERKIAGRALGLEGSRYLSSSVCSCSSMLSAAATAVVASDDIGWSIDAMTCVQVETKGRRKSQGKENECRRNGSWLLPTE